MKKIKLFSLLSIFAVIVVVLSVLVIITCSNEQILNDNNGTTQLQVRIHDEPFKSSGKTVTELNITVVKVDIVRAGTGEIVNCPITKEKEMNILEISKSNPVVLSDVSVPSGDYEQLRLVIKNNATIVVDDVSYDIKIPSGEQSGVKLDGNFSIRGKFIRLDLDFIPEESVIYNKGQGYILKPVIKISDMEDRDILGYFRGELGGREAVIALYDNNTFTAKISMYPDKEIYGDYLYNSLAKTLELKNLEVYIEIKDWFGNVWFSGRKRIREFNNDVEDPMNIPIKQWSPENLIAIETGSNFEIVFNKVDSFSFNKTYTYTKLKVILNYPDDSKNGKDVIVELIPIGEKGSRKAEMSEMIGSKSEVIFSIENSEFVSNNIEYKVIGYLFEDGANKGYTFGYSRNNQLVSMVSGANFSEITENPWQSDIIVTVTKDLNYEKTINFPKRLNIKMSPSNWSTNNPIISWDAYHQTNNDYAVFILGKNQRLRTEDMPVDYDGSDIWDILYYEITSELNIQIFSNKYIVYNPFNSDFDNEVIIKNGDIIRVEVYVLDNSGQLDTSKFEGAIYMDSENFIKGE